MEQGHNKGREPGKTSDYLLPSYWNDRFRDEKGYEWFKGYEEFKHLLLPHLCPGDKILILGCGNSSLTLDLWRDGFKDITSIDLSEVKFSSWSKLLCYNSRIHQIRLMGRICLIKLKRNRPTVCYITLVLGSL